VPPKLVNSGDIASDAMKYVGVNYKPGGGTQNPGVGWDCSGFVNWVLGHDLNMTLPMQLKPGFTGASHGPVVTNYATWSKAITIPASAVEAGDLCIWVGVGNNGHIGIAQSPHTMISALNPALGTIVTPINGQGPAGAPLIHRRVNGTGSPLTGCAPGAKTAATLIARLVWLQKYVRS
jgi:cell wall-associated NlpC family hydrolase